MNRKESVHLMADGLLILSLLFFWIIPAFSQLTTHSDVQVIESTESRILFKYIPPSPRISELKYEDQNYVIFEVDNCSFSTETGSPMVPYRHMVVGVPDGATIQATVLDLQFEEIGEVDLAPFPEIFRQKDDLIDQVEEKYLKNESVYSKDSFFPEIPSQ